MEAKREEWDRSARQLQQMHEGVLAAHATLQGQPQTENSRLQQQLREAQLGELRCQQQIGAARVTAEKAKRRQEELEAKLKALQDELKAVKRDVTPSQFHVPLSANCSRVAKVEPESSVGRLRTLRKAVL
ncbi:hypothetical protein PRNP1_012117 [Phytophthora ramorum]